MQLTTTVFAAILFKSLLALAQPTQRAQCDFTHHHPPRYAVRYLCDAPATLQIDGKLNDPAWQSVPTISIATNIQGGNHDQPYYNTYVKMRYDHQFLYIGMHVEEDHVWANVTQRNAKVFMDNAMEVFVDADASTQSYKEFEINALNTTWNLLLDKPYSNGGKENSGRIDPVRGFDMMYDGMRSAVYMEGRPNDPSQKLKYWSVEMALPLRSLAVGTRATLPPRPMSFWRLNLLRVQWKTLIQNGRYVASPTEWDWVQWTWVSMGSKDIHMPEKWGYIQFRPDGDHGIDVPLDPEWNLRYMVFEYFYAQEAFLKQHQRYANSMQELLPLFSENAKKEKVTECFQLAQYESPRNGTYTALIQSRLQPQQRAILSHDRRIEIMQNLDNKQTL